MKPLSELLFTNNRIYLSTSSATGLWEAAVRNSVQKKCVNFVCGAFSKKWHDITTMSGLEADMISVDSISVKDTSDSKYKRIRRLNTQPYYLLEDTAP